MKLSYRKTKLPSWRLTSVLRIRHWRGHGIHSPFAYSIARKAMMKRKKWHDCHGKEIFDCLCSKGISRDSSSLIQRIYDIGGFEGYSIDQSSAGMVIFTTPPHGLVLSDAACTAILNHSVDSERYKLCKELIVNHDGLSIDCRSVLFFFNDKGLNKEHIKL